MKGKWGRKTTLGAAAAAACLIGDAQSAWAIPELQLYVEGGAYDPTTETWVVDYTIGTPLRLWTIGNVAGSGGKGTIHDVKLAVAYDSASGVSIGLTPSTTGGLGGFTDPSTPIAAVFSKTVTDGSTPTLSDGSSLPTHGVYGSGTDWQEFLLGDFSLTDSPVADFISVFPSAPAVPEGQINVYEVLVTGTDHVHFDLYNSVISGTKVRAVNAPFSHDGEGNGEEPPPPPGGGPGPGPGPVPEPVTAVMSAIGLAALGTNLARRR